METPQRFGLASDTVQVYRDMLLKDRSFSMGEVIMLDLDSNGSLLALSGFDANHTSTATNIHVLGEHDFRGHDQAHLDGHANRCWEISPHHRSPRTQILSHAGSAEALVGHSQKYRQLIREALAAATFDPVLLGGGHAQPI